jgi:lipoprotein-anchoring transpeptidase ErfK/SrfK
VSSGSSVRRISLGSAAAVLAAVVAVAALPAPASAAQPRVVPAAGYLAWPHVAAREAPDAGAPVVAVLAQFDAHFRPRVVLALDVHVDADDRPAWYRLSLPGRPNGRTGWVRAEAVELAVARRAIVIDRSARVLTLREGDRALVRARVAIGARGMETPVGTFYVTRKFRPTSAVLGAFAIETSAYSKLSEWPGGGVVGIHGTDQPWLLGRAVSHGCIRIANADILRLARLTPLGTPIRIVA